MYLALSYLVKTMTKESQFRSPEMPPTFVHFSSTTFIFKKPEDYFSMVSDTKTVIVNFMIPLKCAIIL